MKRYTNIHFIENRAHPVILAPHNLGSFTKRKDFLSYMWDRNNHIYISPNSSKLVINSTPDNIIFENNRAIFLLPSFCLIDKESQFKKDEYDRVFITNDMRYISEQASLFIKQLFTIIKNLSDGEYKFSFFFYIEGKMCSDTMKEVYNFNDFKKKCLIKMDLCNYGYKKLMATTINLNTYYASLELWSMSAFLATSLNKLESLDEFNILHRYIDKDVILMITKYHNNSPVDNGNNLKDISNNVSSSRTYYSSSMRNSSPFISGELNNYSKSLKLSHNRFFSTSITESNFNEKLSSFLTNVKSTLVENKNNPRKAQLIIEEKWIELSSSSIDYTKSIHSSNRKIIYNSLELLNLYKSNGNLNRIAKILKDYIVNIDHVYITFSILISSYNNSSMTNIDFNIGISITKHIYFKHFRKQYPKFEDFIKFYELGNEFFIKLGDVLVETFTTQLNPVFDRVFIHDYYVVKINPIYQNEIMDNLIISPQSLPMVSKPVEWGEGEYGGNLLNSTDNFKKGLVTGSAHHSHKICINRNIYNAVNKLNNFKFKVNHDLVYYLENEGSFILDYLKKQNYDSYLNNIISLDIAKVYIDTPFHLNVNIDWRGRIYTQSFYLDYQGSEFSLALIYLNEGKKLDENGRFFFNIYGANLHNEDGISKKSFKQRNEWVLNNLDRIYSMEKEFILQAESPTNFAAYCLTMRKLRDNPEYIVHNPVFLDATCSGVQHFAAMVLDLQLSKYVNLINTNDEINDFYSTLIPKINKAINESWKEGVDSFKFKDIYLTRDLLKKVIMTKSYNVTTFGITEQLKSKLEKVPKTITIKGKDITVYDYKVPTKNKGYVLLTLFEIERLSDVINNNIFNQFPILQSIYNYLTRLAKIYIKLNIPISWSTPNGLELVQRYNLSKVQKIKINFLGKNRTAVLRKWTDNNDTKREVQAIIPNIIHSLDATHLTTIINKWDKYILPIHDCFGTHPNDMIYLAELVRETFVLLYSNGNFLKKIDDKFRENLVDYKIKTIVKDDIEVVEIPISKNRNMYLPLPVLPENGELEIKDVISKGINMIT